MKIKRKDYIILLLMAVMFFLPYKFIFSKAEEISAVADIDPTISATLYDTNQYSSGTGVELTEEGAEVNGWEYQTSKFLQIDPLVPADGNTYIVTVKLPQELYIVGSDLATPSGYQNVEFTKNESIVINESTSYDLNTFSGTAEYTMNTMGMSGTIQLEIGYDIVLWDKMADSLLTAKEIEPIVVTLSKKDEQGIVTEVKKVSIGKATAGSEFKVSIMNYHAKIEGETSTISNSNINVGKNKKVNLMINDVYGVSSRIYKYYPKMTLIINLPYYTDEFNEKHYLSIDKSNLGFNNIKYTSYQVDTSKMLTDGIVIVDVENMYYYANVIYFWLGPLNEELKSMEESSFLFSNGKISGIAYGKNNIKSETFFTDLKTITYFNEDNFELVTYANHTRSVLAGNAPNDSVLHLGGIYLRNEGTKDSSPKTIHNVFDIENTNYIKVTTMNVPADNVQEYMDVTYTLVDKNGNRVYMDLEGNLVDENFEGAIGEWTYSLKNRFYNSSYTNNLYNTLTRSMLPENQRNYYFKSLKYTINTISKLSTLCINGSFFSHDSGGNFYGYVSENADRTLKSSVEIVSSNSSINTISYNILTVVNKKNRSSYLIDHVEMNKTNIQAGENLIATVRASVNRYPYSYASWLKGVILGVILPKGITINEQAISIITSKEQQIENLEIITQDIGDGNNLWKIKLPSDVYIGYETEKLDNNGIGNGTYIDFSIQLDTEQTLNNISLHAKDMFILAGDNFENGSNGSYLWTLKTDTYDLNENGSTTDNIAGMQSTDTTSCQITAQNASLEITNSITIERQGSITGETTEESLLTQEDIINYNFDIKSTSGGTAEGFEYYIPVPKTTSEVDGVYVKGSSEQIYDLAITGSATLTGNDVFNIEYSFETGISYEEAQELTTWYTSEQIEADSSLNWEDVTIVKITNKEGTSIQNGDITRITLKMKYAGEEYSAEAGMRNTWNSAGYYKYTSGDRVNEGHYTTQGVSVDLKYSIELNEITLTAAGNMEPQIEGNVNTQTVDSTVFPKFKNSHTFSITSVETYNAVLQTKEYIESNIDMPAIDANKTFAITVSMDGETENSVLTDSANNPVELGSISAGSVPEFTFKIYNANSLTDNSQARYIIVTLESENGLTIKQKININRETTNATDPKSAVISGKTYLAFDDTSSSVTISQDSAFTAQFVISYIPNNYKDQRIIFSNNLPIGTNFILANVTDTNNPTYWYYRVSSEVSTINLENFIAMGKMESENYSSLTGIDLIEEKLLVIVDFSQCDTQYPEEGTYTIKMMLAGNDETIEDFTSKELEFVTKQKRSFGVESDANVTLGVNFSVNYYIEATEGAESKYEGRKVSLVLTAPSNIPTDASLIVGNTTYYLNSNKQFIIPLGDVQSLNETITMKICSNMVPTDGAEYEFEIALWVSATANAKAPMLGEKVGTTNILVISDAKEVPSLKVTNIADRVVHKNELTNVNTAEFNYIPVPDYAVTVELQQKIGTAYQKVTDRLNQVNGTTDHDFGAYTISASEGSNQISFILSSLTSTGTYRLVFKVYDSAGTQVLQVPYNLIVTK